MRGHITKRGSGYSIVIDIGNDPQTGKRQQKRFSGYKTKKEAQSSLATIIHELEQGLFVLPTSTTLKEFFGYWLEQSKIKLSPTTVYSYEVIINNHIIPIMGNIKLTDLKPIIINEYYNNKLESLSGRTVLHHHRMLRKALQDAVNWQIIRDNPCDSVEPPKAKKYRPDVYDKEDIKKLIIAISGHELEAHISLALFLGLRRGELLALKWSDINYEHSTITIQRNLVIANSKLLLKEPKTEDSTRTIVLTPEILEILRKHKINQKEQKLKFGKYYTDSNFIFTKENGENINPGSFSHTFADFLKKNNLRHIRLHDLRHTNATLMLMSNVPAKIASARLGHSNISTTLDIYSHVLKDMEKEVSDTISGIIFSTVTKM